MADVQLCTVADLQNQGHMQGLSVADTAWCTNAIKGLTKLAEKMTGRMFTIAERTRPFNIIADQRVIRVPAYGHESSVINSIWQSLSSVNDATTLVSADTYVFDYENGIIERRLGCWLPGVAAVRVKWTGGLASDVSPVVAMQDDLKFAAIMQVSAWYQRRNHLDVASTSMAGDSTTRFSEVDLLPMVKRTIESYAMDL